MTEYDNNLRGALFKNDRKREGKKDPDYKGNVTVESVEYWVDAWLNTSKGGEKYLSLKLRPKEAQQAQAATPPAGNAEGFGDDIPF